jgi:two-component system KDP operon response regulator KdpE
MTGHGYDVLTAANGQEALILAAQQQPDTMILDIALGSEPDGIEVCRLLREWSNMPVIMLSVRDEEKTKVIALNTGADDYLTKPFGMEELHARIQAVLRRVVSEPGITLKAEIRVGELTVNLVNRTVHIRDEEVHLTPKEYDLLRLLITHPGAVLTHRQILREIWG